MPAPKEILDLAERFDRNRDAYKSGQYNETQLRREFLDPFFKALGWDIDNEQGYAEAYKDVIHEDAIKVGEGTKAPDYCFRIGGARKFFLEAKKPAVDIKHDVSPAFQLRRYGFTTKLPLNILSDFEEFAVYDCRFKPDQHDKASVGRILYISCTEYATRWDEIANVFSRDAVLKGSFDKFAESNKAKRGTSDVDDEFLKTIEGWRAELARNLALRNPKLTQRELNFAVQRIIDRIIFLRICEGRGIEDYGRLQALTNGDRIYPRLAQLFEQADDRYNSGLFHFKREKGRHEAPDELTLGLDLDDKLLRDILKSLYYPECPYVFSALPADILGQVYEQFLGKVIRLTEGHRAVVEEKPEVKKAGGVYYTPTYIVEYIVQQTVGKLLEEIAGSATVPVAASGVPPEASSGTDVSRVEASRRDAAKGVRDARAPLDSRSAARILSRVSKLRILDPACGSGSFLLGAYEFLLKWHLDFYAKNDPARWAKGSRPVLVQTSGGWRLTIAERKRILLDNIHGVDIDAQAVETTKLSLLLKVLEGETQQSLQPLLRMFQERALPDLGDNIKCGNSLIGPDFYQQSELPLLTDEERYRINVFDWEKEFPEVFKAGGFDGVIGNPPYIRIQTMQDSQPQEVEFFSRAYSAASQGNYDIYVVFVERGLSLLNNSGRLGFILPHKFFNSQYGEPLRGLLAEGKHLSHVVHFGDKQVFSGATTYTCLLFLERSGAKVCAFTKVDDLDAWRTNRIGTSGWINAIDIGRNEWNFVVGRGAQLFERLKKMPVKLADVVSGMFVGQQTSADTVYLFKESRVSKKGNTDVFSKELDEWVAIESALLKPVVRSGSIKRYKAEATAQVLFPYHVEDCAATLFSPAEMSKDYPLAWDYLKRNKSLLAGREKGKFQAESWYRHDQMVNLVEQMLELHQRLAAARTPPEKTSLERQIAATDAQIDRLVYDLYGLTEEEIKIVEGTDK